MVLIQSMKILSKNIFDVIFYAVMSLVALSLFLTSFIQGFILQVVYGNLIGAFWHYFGSLLALITASFIFMRAKRVITILSRSDFIEQFLRN